MVKLYGFWRSEFPSAWACLCVEILWAVSEFAALSRQCDCSSKWLPGSEVLLVAQKGGSRNWAFCLRKTPSLQSSPLLPATRTPRHPFAEHSLSCSKEKNTLWLIHWSHLMGNSTGGVIINNYLHNNSLSSTDLTKLGKHKLIQP